MKEKKNEDVPIGKNANTKINTNAFMRQISHVGSNANEQESTTASVQAVEQEENVPVKRKRTTSLDYETRFLHRNELSNRQGLYISKENYEVLQTLVRSIRTERLSLSGLVDNIISYHIELHGDDINRIYEENSTKPIKK